LIFLWFPNKTIEESTYSPLPSCRFQAKTYNKQQKPQHFAQQNVVIQSAKSSTSSSYDIFIFMLN
jgi:hypothetical protein